MNNSLLITRPNHDITTNYLYYWSEKIINEAEKRSVKTVDLKGKRANKKELTGIIHKVQPALIVFNGHGNSNSITGYDNEVLIEADDNEEILSGKIAYAVSCSSAEILGPVCVKAGARAYIGYTDDFAFMIAAEKITKPLEDKSARLFLEPSNQVAISLLKGNTTGKAYKSSQDVFRRNINHLLTSESSQEEKEALPYLLWDIRHQVCLGNQDAGLYSEATPFR